MKIGIFCIDFLPNIGGIASHVYELSKELVKQGNDVHVISFKKTKESLDYEEIDGIKIHRVFYSGGLFFGRIKYLFLAYRKIKKLIKEKKIEIIHTHDLYPDGLLYLFLPKKFPKILTEHSSNYLNWYEYKFLRPFLYWVMNKADFVFGPSKELVYKFRNTGIPKNKSKFISNAVDDKKFRPDIKISKRFKEKYGIETGEKIILIPRRLEPKNGVIYGVKAMPEIIKEFPNCKCIVVGGGWEEEREKMMKEIKREKMMKNIIFTGNVPNTQMPFFYSISDVVLLPSLQEATSISGLEAMSCGKPLVGTNIGGIPYIIEDKKTGFLVEPKNPKEISKIIIKLFKDPLNSKKVGQNAREIIEKRFSWEIITKEFYKIYVKILRGKLKCAE